MRKVFAAIAIGFIALGIAFSAMGGIYDKPFWLNVIPGLMENLAVAALVVFVVDRIFATERLEKLRQTNARESENIHLLSNRLAYLILEFFNLAKQEEIRLDKDVDFSFAVERLKTINLPEVFYEALIKTEDRKSYIDKFVQLLREHMEGISKALSQVYPRPRPDIRAMVDEIPSAIGGISVLGAVVEGIAVANKAVSTHDRWTPEQSELFIELVYFAIDPNLSKVQQCIIKLSNKAKENRLFMSFD